MKNKKNIYTISVLIILIGISSLTAISNSKIREIPQDGKNSVLASSMNINGCRYLEVLVVGGNLKTKKLYAQCYNITNYNGPDSRNSAPKNLVDLLNTKEITAQFGGFTSFINGPRVWCLDWAKTPSGEVRDFNGLQARWVAKLELNSPNQFSNGKPSYLVSKIERKSSFGINKGSKVFLLDDNIGNTWVMKSYSLKENSNLKMSDVPSIMHTLNLPEGWSFRINTLEEDLILRPKTGIAKIISDDKDNVYDLSGPGYSNIVL